MNSRPYSNSVPLGPSARHPDVSLRELWRILSIRRQTVFAAICIMLVLSAGISLLMTPKYEAVSIIVVNKENSDVLGLDQTAAGGAGSDMLDYNTTLQTQAGVLQTDSLAFQVSEQLGLEKYKQFRLRPVWFNQNEVNAEFDRPLEKAPLRRAKIHKVFEKNLKIKTVAGTRMIEVHFFDPDPQVAADVANTLVNDYLEQYFKTRYNATAQASQWLSRQLEDLKLQVEQSQEKLNRLQKEAGILGTDETNNVIMAKLEELNKQVTAAEANRMLKEAVYQVATSGDPELISSMASSTLIGGSISGINPNSLVLIQNLRSQEAVLKVQLAQTSTKYGPNYPKLMEARNQLQELEAAIHAETEKLAGRARNDYIAARNAESLLRASFEQQKIEANKLNDSAIQYTILKREVESGRELYEDLLKKLKEGGVLAGLRCTNIVVVDPARTSAKPERPNWPINLALGLTTGLLGGIALAFVRENLDNTIRTPEQIEAAGTLTSIGIIPERDMAGPRSASQKLSTERLISLAPRRLFGGQKERLNETYSVLDAPWSPMAEAYRSLRTSLWMSKVERAPQVLLITSALPREGKTTISLNAAITLAQQGSKVLLIDADLRHPALHEQANVAPAPGLSELLQSADGAANGLEPNFVSYPGAPNISILPAGQRPNHPAELLSCERMQTLIANSRKQFDFIIIDSPPVLSVTDPVLLSTIVDAVLLVARSERTTTEALLSARELLARANAHIAGVLVNRVNTRSHSHYFYCGYTGC